MYAIPFFEVIIIGLEKAIEDKNTKKHPQIKGLTAKFSYLSPLEMPVKRHWHWIHWRNWGRKQS